MPSCSPKEVGMTIKSPLRHNVNGLTVTAAASEEMRQVRREGKHVVRPVVKPSFKFSASQLQPRSRTVDMCSTVTKETRLHMSAHDCHCKNS